MQKKPLMALAPALALAMSAAMPVAAQATLCGPPNSPAGQGTPSLCNWYNHNSGAAVLMPGGQLAVVFIHGGFTTTDISQIGPSGEVACQTVGFAQVENPGVGDRKGIGKMIGVQFISCKEPSCEKAATEGGLPLETIATAENLPWKVKLFEGGSPTAVRARIGLPFSGTLGTPSPEEMVVRLACETPPGFEPHIVDHAAKWEGELTPEIGVGKGPGPGLNTTDPAEMGFSGASSGVLHSEIGELNWSGLLHYGTFNHIEVW